MSGTLENFTRDGAKEAILERGGKSPGSVSKKTLALVVGADPGRVEGHQGRRSRCTDPRRGRVPAVCSRRASSPMRELMSAACSPGAHDAVGGGGRARAQPSCPAVKTIRGSRSPLVATPVRRGARVGDLGRSAGRSIAQFSSADRRRGWQRMVQLAVDSSGRHVQTRGTSTCWSPSTVLVERVWAVGTSIGPAKPQFDLVGVGRVEIVTQRPTTRSALAGFVDRPRGRSTRHRLLSVPGAGRSRPRQDPSPRFGMSASIAGLLADRLVVVARSSR